MWYFAKALQIIGMIEVLVGIIIGISQDDLGAEYKFALVGVAIFLVGRFLESKLK